MLEIALDEFLETLAQEFKHDQAYFSLTSAGEANRSVIKSGIARS